MTNIFNTRPRDALNFEIIEGQKDASSDTGDPIVLTTTSMELETKEVAIDFTFIRQLQGKPNSEAKTADFHGQLWDVSNGGMLEIAKLEASQASKEADDADADYKKAKAKLDNTERYEFGGETHDEDGNPVKGKSTRYREWPKYDLIKVSFLCMTCFALLALGGVNVAVLILGSGIPAFLDNPALAYLLGAIVPAIAMALKSAEELLPLDRHKHWYAVTIYILAGIVSLAWIVLFTITFEGNTADIWSDIDESVSDHTVFHTLRNITQILAEVLTGAALFLVIDRMHSKHSAKSISEKTGWRELSDRVDELRKLRNSSAEYSNAKAAVQTQLEATRTAFILSAIGHLSD